MSDQNSSPIADLDVEVLGPIGLVLEELEFPSARRYFDALLDRATPNRHNAPWPSWTGPAAVSRREFFRRGALAGTFSNETLVHPLSAEATLLPGRTLTGLGDAAAAISTI